jgi:anaerobic C4-dicarboxylate transporter
LESAPPIAIAMLAGNAGIAASGVTVAVVWKNSVDRKTKMKYSNNYAGKYCT